MAVRKPIPVVRAGRPPRPASAGGDHPTPQAPARDGMHPTVDIVGSTIAVPESVASQVQALGLKVRRFDPATAAADAVSTVRGDYQSYVVVSRPTSQRSCPPSGATLPCC